MPIIPEERPFFRDHNREIGDLEQTRNKSRAVISVSRQVPELLITRSKFGARQRVLARFNFWNRKNTRAFISRRK